MLGPLVWQGSAGDRRPYADLTGNADCDLKAVGMIV